jgi:hypothetical protein
MSEITITRTEGKIRGVVLLRRQLGLGLKEARDFLEGKPIEISDEHDVASGLYLDLLGIGVSAIIKPPIQNWKLESLINYAQDEILLQARRIEQAKQLLSDPTRRK